MIQQTSNFDKNFSNYKLLYTCCSQFHSKIPRVTTEMDDMIPKLIVL